MHEITLLFFWLNSPALAIERVKTRVKEGGHHIPEDVIRRRYESGLINFFRLFQPIVNDWMFIDNSGEPYQIIATESGSKEDIINHEVWNELKIKYHGK